jgi:hypothetical protein
MVRSGFVLFLLATIGLNSLICCRRGDAARRDLRLGPAQLDACERVGYERYVSVRFLSLFPPLLIYKAGRHIDNEDEGFPGTVTVMVRLVHFRMGILISAEGMQATHTVADGGVLRTVVRATATEKTPIMLTQHIYWCVLIFHSFC